MQNLTEVFLTDNFISYLKTCNKEQNSCFVISLSGEQAVHYNEQYTSFMNSRIHWEEEKIGFI